MTLFDLVSLGNSGYCRRHDGGGKETRTAPEWVVLISYNGDLAMGVLERSLTLSIGFSFIISHIASTSLL